MKSILQPLEQFCGYTLNCLPIFDISYPEDLRFLNHKEQTKIIVLLKQFDLAFVKPSS